MIDTHCLLLSLEPQTSSQVDGALSNNKSVVAGNESQPSSLYVSALSDTTNNSTATTPYEQTMLSPSVQSHSDISTSGRTVATQCKQPLCMLSWTESSDQASTIVEPTESKHVENSYITDFCDKKPVDLKTLAAFLESLCLDHSFHLDSSTGSPIDITPTQHKQPLCFLSETATYEELSSRLELTDEDGGLDVEETVNSKKEDHTETGHSNVELVSSRIYPGHDSREESGQLSNGCHYPGQSMVFDLNSFEHYANVDDPSLTPASGMKSPVARSTSEKERIAQSVSVRSTALSASKETVSLQTSLYDSLEESSCSPIIISQHKQPLCIRSELEDSDSSHPRPQPIDREEGPVTVHVSIVSDDEEEVELDSLPCETLIPQSAGEDRDFGVEETVKGEIHTDTGNSVETPIRGNIRKEEGVAASVSVKSTSISAGNESVSLSLDDSLEESTCSPIVVSRPKRPLFIESESEDSDNSLLQPQSIDRQGQEVVTVYVSSVCDEEEVELQSLPCENVTPHSTDEDADLEVQETVKFGGEIDTDTGVSDVDLVYVGTEKHCHSDNWEESCCQQTSLSSSCQCSGQSMLCDRHVDDLSITTPASTMKSPITRTPTGKDRNAVSVSVQSIASSAGEETVALPTSLDDSPEESTRSPIIVCGHKRPLFIQVESEDSDHSPRRPQPIDRQNEIVIVSDDEKELELESLPREELLSQSAGKDEDLEIEETLSGGREIDIDTEDSDVELVSSGKHPVCYSKEESVHLETFLSVGCSYPEKSMLFDLSLLEDNREIDDLSVTPTYGMESPIKNNSSEKEEIAVHVSVTSTVTSTGGEETVALPTSLHDSQEAATCSPIIISRRKRPLFIQSESEDSDHSPARVQPKDREEVVTESDDDEEEVELESLPCEGLVYQSADEDEDSGVAHIVKGAVKQQTETGTSHGKLVSSQEHGVCDNGEGTGQQEESPPDGCLHPERNLHCDRKPEEDDGIGGLTCLMDDLSVKPVLGTKTPIRRKPRGKENIAESVFFM